ncbi:hypothetical protein L4C34_19285 [Vibrio profundum]|uniref:hypothetical protein n=1 Tax=Vibrio profundum TaxID=2910247 RepID=UPI003D0E6AA3
MDNNKGVVYIAFGHLYLTMALFSISTLRRKNRTLPVMIITNLDVEFKKLSFWSDSRDISKIINLDTRKNREIKTDLYKYVPYDRVAYIDADTYILNDLNNAWKFLDYFDIALKLNPTKQKKIGKGDQLVIDSSTYVRDVPHFNSGVVFFRKSEKAKNFFTLWSKSFCEGNTPYDQVSLVDSIFKCDARVLPLTEDWNYFPDRKYYAGKVKSPHIVHYTNRISYSLEVELLKISSILGFDVSQIRKEIYLKRMARREKIGLRNWLQLLFYWRFLSKHEEGKWNI